ncbi:MAG TPA: metal-dependent hydrolase [Candidatus Korarchaeota archaeon]|nr:metal-dependent hydrolase [Candidatus Korarchaeota archaeon]
MAKITWLGHAAFLLEAGGKRIAFDPWISGNPKCPISLEDFKGADIYAVSHSHNDHGLNDAIKLSKEKGGVIVGIFELANYASEKGAKAVGANIGGFFEVEGIEIALTEAIHSSDIGAPVGFLVRIENRVYYHAGDTGLFGGMSLIGDLYSPEVSMLPIGGYYTMDPVQASLALKILRSRMVAPMHWGTFPVLKGTPDDLEEEVKKRGIKVKVLKLKPGVPIEI